MEEIGNEQVLIEAIKKLIKDKYVISPGKSESSAKNSRKDTESAKIIIKDIEDTEGEIASLQRALDELLAATKANLVEKYKYHELKENNLQVQPQPQLQILDLARDSSNASLAS